MIEYAYRQPSGVVQKKDSDGELFVRLASEQRARVSGFAQAVDPSPEDFTRLQAYAAEHGFDLVSRTTQTVTTTTDWEKVVAPLPQTLESVVRHGGKVWIRLSGESFKSCWRDATGPGTWKSDADLAGAEVIYDAGAVTR